MFDVNMLTEKRGAGLAPMAGVTDAAMRLLCCEQGAAWAVSEMLLMPAISGLGVNEYVYVLLRDVLLKSAVWILPAMLLIKRFSDDMSAGFKELFTFSRASRKTTITTITITMNPSRLK